MEVCEKVGEFRYDFGVVKDGGAKDSGVFEFGFGHVGVSFSVNYVEIGLSFLEVGLVGGNVGANEFNG